MTSSVSVIKSHWINETTRKDGIWIHYEYAAPSHVPFSRDYYKHVVYNRFTHERIIEIPDTCKTWKEKQSFVDSHIPFNQKEALKLEITILKNKNIYLQGRIQTELRTLDTRNKKIALLQKRLDKLEDKTHTF